MRSALHFGLCTIYSKHIFPWIRYFFIRRSINHGRLFHNEVANSFAAFVSFLWSSLSKAKMHLFIKRTRHSERRWGFTFLQSTSSVRLAKVDSTTDLVSKANYRKRRPLKYILTIFVNFLSKKKLYRPHFSSNF